MTLDDKIKRIFPEESVLKDPDKYIIFSGYGLPSFVKDWLIKNYTYPQKYIVKGDSKSASIAASSILAKVTRDRYMENLAQEFPQYGWDHNAGYLTKEHLEAIDKYGLSPYHRPSFLQKHFEKQLTLL